jgi:rhodanese-related sulfurtransferase
MKTMKLLFLISASLCLVGQAAAQDIPEITSKEAYEMLKDPAVRLVDVRSIAEYYFTGHPETAANVPLTFWDEKTMSLLSNDHFTEDIKARFQPQQTLVFICRSGGRSLKAAQLARAAGFPKVYSVKEGFEGEKDAQGHRTVGGWKNSDLPYTYEINKNLIYQWP